MKRTLLSLILCVCVLFCVFANQKTYRLSSDEVQTFLRLRRASGTVTADPTYPITASQLSNLLRSIDSSKLSGELRDSYDSLLDSLENPVAVFRKDGVAIDPAVTVLGVEVIHSDVETSNDAVIMWGDRMPRASILTTFYMDENAAGLFEMNSRKRAKRDGEDYHKNYVLTAKGLMDWSEGYPDYAYFSVGSEHLNLMVARDRLGSGNGFTGNLELGENSALENFAKLSFATGFFSYDLTLNSFIPGVSSEDDLWTTAFKKNTFIHRMSFNILDKVALSVYEGALVYSQNIVNDIRFLNPFMVLHNIGSYYAADTNNFLGLEATAALPFNVQLNAQAFMDQIVLSFEDPEESGESAYAVLANLSRTQNAGNGILTYYAEGVYANEFCYLKNSHGYGMEEGDAPDCSTLDFVFDVQVDYNKSYSRINEYMGYRYGGDVLALGLGADYQMKDLKLDLSFLHLAKGTNGFDEGEHREASARKEGDVIQYTDKVTLHADAMIFNGIELKGQCSLVKYTNLHHEAGNNPLDFTYAFAVAVHPLDMLGLRK